jgi:predicted  nucleic acid-binding Zn-ribbon protein
VKAIDRLRELQAIDTELAAKIADLRRFNGQKVDEISSVQANVQTLRAENTNDIRELHAIVSEQNRKLSLRSQEERFRDHELTNEKRRQADRLATAVQRLEIRSAIQRLERRRRSAASRIPGPTLARYEAVRRETGSAIAEISGRTCQSCHARLSPAVDRQARSGDELVRCKRCGRFLRVASSQNSKKRLEGSSRTRAGIAPRIVPGVHQLTDLGTLALTTQQPASNHHEIGFDELCRSCTVVKWRDRDWLRIVADETWHQANTLKQYTIPSGAVFPFEDEVFVGRTGVASLRFTSDSRSEVRVRFDLKDGRCSTVALKRNLRLPMGRWPLQDLLVAVATATYRDCVVVDRGSLAADTPVAGIRFRLSPGLKAASEPSHKPRRLDVPQTYPRARSPDSGTYSSGNSASPHSVRGHVRRLPPSRRASAEQLTIAISYGIALAPDETFVRPHFRGGEDTTGAREREARSRRMAPALVASLHYGVTWV